MQCAAPLSAPARAVAEERKVVSVLFCDLVGFTASSEAADPEDVARMLAAYFRVARAQIASQACGDSSASEGRSPSESCGFDSRSPSLRRERYSSFPRERESFRSRHSGLLSLPEDGAPVLPAGSVCGHGDRLTTDSLRCACVTSLVCNCTPT